jgi:hypothetical protein
MSCTAAVDSYAATISSGKSGEGCQLFYLKGAKLTINVLKQQWKKENNRVLF